MANKTAMMELVDYMKANFHLTDESLEKFEQFLEKEKEQIMDAFDQGDYLHDVWTVTGEDYYKETYLKDETNDK